MHRTCACRTAYVAASLLLLQRLGSPETTAQVHPHKLTHALLDASKARGAAVVKGTVQGLKVDPDHGHLTGVYGESGTWARHAVCDHDGAMGELLVGTVQVWSWTAPCSQRMSW